MSRGERLSSSYRPRVGFYPLLYVSLRGVAHQTTGRANKFPAHPTLHSTVGLHRPLDHPLQPCRPTYNYREFVEIMAECTAQVAHTTTVGEHSLVCLGRARSAVSCCPIIKKC